MKSYHLPCFLFLMFMACTGNNTDQVAATSSDTAIDRKATSASPHNTKHVDWEIGNVENVNKIMQFYKLWDEKEAFVNTDYFADTVRLHLPDVRGEIVVPNSEITKRLRANRDMYDVTSNDIMSSVALRDKVSGEDWVMVTAYSKWIEADGKRDSVLYHDDWRLADGKINLLVSFYRVPPKGFVNSKD